MRIRGIVLEIQREDFWTRIRDVMKFVVWVQVLDIICSFSVLYGLNAGMSKCSILATRRRA